jgi:hypothetical protein
MRSQPAAHPCAASCRRLEGERRRRAQQGQPRATRDGLGSQMPTALRPSRRRSAAWRSHVPASVFVPVSAGALGNRVSTSDRAHEAVRFRPEAMRSADRRPHAGRGPAGRAGRLADDARAVNAARRLSTGISHGATIAILAIRVADSPATTEPVLLLLSWPAAERRGRAALRLRVRIRCLTPELMERLEVRSIRVPRSLCS